MKVGQASSIAILIILLSIIFSPSILTGTLTLDVAAEEQSVEVKLLMADLEAHPAGLSEFYGWEKLVKEVELTLPGAPKALSSSIHVGRYDKLRFKVLNASAVVNGSLVPLKIEPKELTVNVDFRVKPFSKTSVAIKLSYDEERIIKDGALSLTVETFP